MGVQERRAREKEELRAQILEAARVFLAEHGYEAVSMRRIAEQIEDSATAIHEATPLKLGQRVEAAIAGR